MYTTVYFKEQINKRTIWAFNIVLYWTEIETADQISGETGLPYQYNIF